MQFYMLGNVVRGVSLEKLKSMMQNVLICITFHDTSSDDALKIVILGWIHSLASSVCIRVVLERTVILHIWVFPLNLFNIKCIIQEDRPLYLLNKLSNGQYFNTANGASNLISCFNYFDVTSHVTRLVKGLNMWQKDRKGCGL